MKIILTGATPGDTPALCRHHAWQGVYDLHLPQWSRYIREREAVLATGEERNRARDSDEGLPSHLRLPPRHYEVGKGTKAYPDDAVFLPAALSL